MPVIAVRARDLAEIGESSPGYAVEVWQSPDVHTIRNIRYARTPANRRDKSTVVFEYADGRAGRIDAHRPLEILD